MIGGILFFIAEIKLLEDNAAQLFVKILGAFILLLGEFLVTVELVSSGCQSERESRFCESAHIWPPYRPHRLPFLLLQSSYENICVRRDTGCEHHERRGIRRHDPRYVLFSTYDQTYPVGNKLFSVILTAYIDGLEATAIKSTERKHKSVPRQQMRSQNAPSEPGVCLK